MRWQGWALALSAGLLYSASFPNVSMWPLAFVALVPLMRLLDVVPEGRSALGYAALAGLVANLGRGYFLVETLVNFSALPWVVCAAVTLLLSAYQGGQLVLLVWLLRRARSRGLLVGAVAPVAFAATELLYPRLFQDYLANALHDQRLALQVVDLGGPGLLSIAVVLVSGAVYEGLRAVVDKQPMAPFRNLAALAAATWTLILVYGAHRVGEVEHRMAHAERMTVGLVQANAGMFDKHKERRKYYLRHYRDSQALEREVDLDLLVWPETSVYRVRDTKKTHGTLKTPLLFGAHTEREQGGRKHRYNSALLTDAGGEQIGRYDKVFLLPFGEYLPFGELFPILYDWSPQSGRFTAGDNQRALTLGRFRLGTLICYEDVAPGFVRQTMREGDPHVLVNLTNDAWFGDTNAAQLHLALAKFRAVEHHRHLVRATNSGVTAVIDPTGQVVAEAEPFTRARIHASVSRMEGQSIYVRAGNWPGLLALLTLAGALLYRRKPRA